jgi:hypothetical protein
MGRRSAAAVDAPPTEARWRSRLRRFDAAIDSIVDYRALVPLRIAVGLLTLVHLAPFLSASLGGTTYRDTFHIPPPWWYPELPEPVFVVALWIAGGAAAMMAMGFMTRPATIASTTFVVYNLLVTETHYHHNRAFLAVLLVGLSLMPVGDQVSVDARIGRVPPAGAGLGPRWPLMLLRFQIAAVYAASGVSKLLDSDWISGVVLQLRVEYQAAAATAAGVPAGLVELATSPTVQWWGAKVVVATEIFIGCGLLWRRTRSAAVWVAIPFHVAIHLTAAVEVFSFAGLAALLIWVEPRSRDRRLTAPPHWAQIVAALDWTGRFSITASERWRLEDRDGTVLSDSRAAVRCAALIPVTFWWAAPLEALAKTPIRTPDARAE